MRRHQAGHGVPGTRPGSHKHRRRPTGGTGVSVCHVNRSLFVTNEDEFHLGLDRFEGVENRDGCSSGISKDKLDPEVIEGLDQGLGAVKLLLAHGFADFGGKISFPPNVSKRKLIKFPENENFYQFTPPKIEILDEKS
jgi:hypothetical protein